MLERDPFSGNVFVFRRKRGDMLSVLWQSGDSLCLLTKRLEKSPLRATVGHERHGPAQFCAASGLFQYRFHAAFSGNFQGDAGIHALESNVVRELEAMVADWPKVQLLEKVKEAEKVFPINPFAQ